MTQTISPEVPNPVSPARELPDWRLLRACTEGAGDDCWRELVDRRGAAVERTLRRLLLRSGGIADPAAVQDLLQEVYLRLLNCWRRPAGRFRGASDAEATAFLHRIAIRVVLDARRDASAGKRGGGSRTLQLETVFAEDRPAPAGDRPDQRMERRERRVLFRRRCRALLGARASPRSVRVAELAILDGLSSREIARAFGGRLRETGINSTVYRLRRRLERSGIAIPRRMRRSARSPR